MFPASGLCFTKMYFHEDCLHHTAAQILNPSVFLDFSGVFRTIESGKVDISVNLLSSNRMFEFFREPIRR